MTGIERLRELTDATLGYVRVASVTPHDYEYENDVEWDERMRLSELLASIYSQISREQDAMVADSPYDAILPEDRDAIAWVREHGGLAEVKEEWNARSNLKRSLETAQAKVERQQRLIEFAQRKCHERLERIAALNKTIAEMRPRLMPEGMEWPTVDGKPVDFVTGYEPSLGVLEAVSIYNNGACEVMGHDGIIKNVKEIHVATPKVLDADGVEIREGDEVWSTTGEFDGKRTVSSVYIDPGEPPYAMFEERQKPYSCLCFYLTHRAPVLAADGKPLREGQTVWDENGDELVIVALEDGGQTVTCRYVDVGDAIPVHGMWSPSQLTHTKPEIDTWQRIEEDAGCTATKYNERRGTIFTTKQQVARDLVRRAKALAGRDAS